MQSSVSSVAADGAHDRHVSHQGLRVLLHCANIGPQPWPPSSRRHPPHMSCLPSPPAQSFGASHMALQTRLGGNESGRRDNGMKCLNGWKMEKWASPPVESYVQPSAGAPRTVPMSRAWHGSAVQSAGPCLVLAFNWGHRWERISCPAPQ
jgi:hypothetical protein